MDLSGISIVVIILAVLLLFIAVASYKRLSAGRAQYKQAFAHIDKQLTCRHDQVPQLVQFVAERMPTMQPILNEIVTAKDTAVAVLDKTKADPSYAETVKQLNAAEQALSSKLLKLYAQLEGQSELPEQEAIMKQVNAMTIAESKVSFARQTYNEVVQTFNHLRSMFPNHLVAKLSNIQKAVLIEITPALMSQE